MRERATGLPCAKLGRTCCTHGGAFAAIDRQGQFNPLWQQQVYVHLARRAAERLRHAPMIIGGTVVGRSVASVASSLLCVDAADQTSSRSSVCSTTSAWKVATTPSPNLPRCARHHQHQWHPLAKLERARKVVPTDRTFRGLDALLLVRPGPQAPSSPAAGPRGATQSVESIEKTDLRGIRFMLLVPVQVEYNSLIAL